MFGVLGAVLGPLMAFLGPSWSHPGVIWASLDAVLGRLGATLGQLGPLVNPLRPCRGHLGALFGSSLGHFGAMEQFRGPSSDHMRLSWTNLRTSSATCKYTLII